MLVLEIKTGFLHRTVVSIWLMSSRWERVRPANTRVSVCSALLAVCLQSVCFPMGKCKLGAVALTLERGRGAVHQPGQMFRFIFQHAPGRYYSAPQGTHTHIRECDVQPLQCVYMCAFLSDIQQSCRQQEAHTAAVQPVWQPVNKLIFKPTTLFGFWENIMIYLQST